MFIKDQNDQAIILLGIKDKNSVLYFPSNCKNVSDQSEIHNYWGLFFKIDPRTPVEEQIVHTILSYTDISSSEVGDLNICSNFRSKIYIDSVPTSLYLVLKESRTDVKNKEDYKKISDIIKNLPNNKNRISYMFIVQYLGSLNLDDVDAVSMSKAELDKYFDQNSR